MNSLEEANDILNVKISLMKAKMKQLRGGGSAKEREGEGEECQGEEDKIPECAGKRVREEEEKPSINLRKRGRIDARNEKEENVRASKEESKEEPIADTENAQVVPASDLTTQRPTDASPDIVEVKEICRVTRVTSRRLRSSLQQWPESAGGVVKGERKRGNVGVGKERELEGLPRKVKEG